MTQLEQLQVAIEVAKREYLDTKLMTVEDIDILLAMDYENTYGDMGATVFDKIPVPRYLSFLARTQMWDDDVLQEVDNIINEEYEDWCILDEQRELLELNLDDPELPY